MFVKLNLASLLGSSSFPKPAAPSDAWLPGKTSPASVVFSWGGGKVDVKHSSEKEAVLSASWQRASAGTNCKERNYSLTLQERVLGIPLLVRAWLFQLCLLQPRCLKGLGGVCPKGARKLLRMVSLG